MNRWAGTTLALVTLAALTAAAACTPATLNVDESLDGARVRAARGEFLSIALPSHPDADPGWVVTLIDRSALRAEEPPRFVPRADAGDAPGVTLFRYRVMADGETYLGLQYVPGAEGASLEIDTFGVTLVVGGPARHFP